MTEKINLTNKWSLQLRVVSLIGIGFILLKVNHHSPRLMVLLLVAFILMAGISGLVFAISNGQGQIIKNWLIVESLADIVLAMVSLWFYFMETDLGRSFMVAFACFSIAFSFLQFIYMFQIAISGLLPNINIIVVRAIMAVCYGLFGIILLYQFTLPSPSIFLINLIGIGPLIAGLTLSILSYKLYVLKK